METTFKELAWLEQLKAMVVAFAPKLLLAIVLLIVGIKLINLLADLAGKAMGRAGVSPNILPFINSLVGIGLKLLLFFSIAGIVGIDTASFVAVLAAAGFAVGLALQGSLSNFAAGIIILIFRPYKVGDWIEMDEKFGKVEEIQIFNTIIVTPGRKTLIIPNGQVVENIVTNYSAKGKLRLELRVNMAYAESFPRVKEILEAAVRTSPFLLEDPNPEIGIETYDTHYIVIGVRPYVQPDDFWEATFDMHARIKRAFYENNIKMAYSEGVELGSIGE